SHNGQVLVLVAIALVVLVSFVALAVDAGFMWGTRRKMQSAADAAASAGAVASRQGYNVTSAANKVASLNGFTDGANGVTIAVHNPYSGCGTSTNCVQVIIDQAISTYFLMVLGFGSMHVKPSAAAGTTISRCCV